MISRTPTLWCFFLNSSVEWLRPHSLIVKKKSLKDWPPSC